MRRQTPAGKIHPRFQRSLSELTANPASTSHIHVWNKASGMSACRATTSCRCYQKSQYFTNLNYPCRIRSPTRCGECQVCSIQYARMLLHPRDRCRTLVESLGRKPGPLYRTAEMNRSIPTFSTVAEVCLQCRQLTCPNARRAAVSRATEPTYSHRLHRPRYLCRSRYLTATQAANHGLHPYPQDHAAGH